MLLINRIIKILFVILFFASVAYSQTETEQDTTVTVQSDVSDTTFVMTKSPMGAVGRSALIPGWGQYYTESYWKIPVIWGFMGYFGYVWVDQNNKYKEYRDLYKNGLNSGDTVAVYKTHRDFYRDQRDEFAIYFFLTYFIQLVDAYVDAHMFDFSVKPDPVTKSPQLGIKFHF